MSCEICQWCDRLVDTDYDVEGAYEQQSPFRYKCKTCLEADNQGPSAEGYIMQLDEDGNEVAA